MRRRRTRMLLLAGVIATTSAILPVGPARAAAGPSVVSIADATVTEGPELDRTTISMTNPTGRYCQVSVTTVNGTATAPGDYSAIPGANFDVNGDPLDLQINDDVLIEPAETFTVNLVLTANSDPECQAGDMSAKITIADNDVASVISIADATVTEGPELDRTTISMTNPAGRQCKVSVTTVNGTATAPGDYSAIPSANFDVNGDPLDLQIANNATAEPLEWFTINLSLVAGSDPRCVMGDGSARINVVDDDGPTTPAPFPSWSALVARLYQDIVGVPPTASESSAWVASLSGGTITVGQMAEFLRRGPENSGNVDPVARLYRAFLQRTPDAGGLRFWIARRRTGAWTLNRIAQHFATSSEFTTKYGTLTNSQFVSLIYTDVLERSPDPAGLAYWTRQLDQRRRNRGGVMLSFSDSSEYKRKQLENTDAAVAHILLLGRAPTSGENSAWVGFERSDPSLHDDLLADLIHSAAYAAHIGS